MQVLFAPHWPEQQSVPVAQALPAVLQTGLSGAQVPFVHVPPQHWVSLVQLPLSETQACVAHLPSTPHWKVQHSGPLLQLPPSAVQTPTTEAHFWVLGSQTPEQQSGL